MNHEAEEIYKQIHYTVFPIKENFCNDKVEIILIKFITEV